MMEKSARRFVGISSILHSCIYRSRYARPARYATTYAHYSQDASTAALPTSENEQNTKSQEENNVSAGGAQADGSHLDVCYVRSALSYLRDYATDNGRRKRLDINVTRDKTFLQSCETINRDIRYLRTRDVVVALRCMDVLRVPTEATIVQKLLQMIRVNVNELSLKDILFLKQSLYERVQTPLVRALRKALPAVFEAQIQTIDKDNVSDLITSLIMACEYNNGPIIEVLSAQILKKSEMLQSSNKLVTLYRYLNVTAAQTVSSEALKAVLEEHFIECRNSLSYKQALMLLKVFYIKKKQGKLKKHNIAYILQTMFDCFLQYKPSIEDTFQVLSLSNEIRYSNKPILDYLASKIIKDPSILSTSSMHITSDLVSCINTASYESPLVEIVRDVISHRQFLTLRPNAAVDFAYNLAALKIFEPRILSYVFNNYEQITYRRSLLSLYQYIRAYCPEYNGSLPPLVDLTVETNATVKKISTLSHSLVCAAVGGPQYIKNTLWTNLGHLVDHVVVVRPNNQYVNMANIFPNDKNLVESLKPPSGSQVILIFNVVPEAYPINSRVMRNTWFQTLRTAEVCTGYRVVPITVFELTNNYRYKERIEYLRSLLKYRPEPRPLSRFDL